MPFLPALISNASRSSSSFVLLESSASQSCLPVLRAVVSHKDPKSAVVLFCLLYPPSSLVNDPDSLHSDRIQVHDRTALVPGYCDEDEDIETALLNAIDAGWLFDGAETCITELLDSASRSINCRS